MPIPTAALPFVTIIKVIFLSSVHKSYLKLVSELPALSLIGALLWPGDGCLLRKILHSLVGANQCEINKTESTSCEL